MLADLVQVKARAELEREGVKATVVETGHDGNAFTVSITASEPSVLAALVLRYQRETHGLSLADVAERLGNSSRNAFASYERGKREPSLSKFIELLAVLAPDMAMTIGPRVPTAKVSRESSFEVPRQSSSISEMRRGRRKKTL